MRLFAPQVATKCLSVLRAVGLVLVLASAAHAQTFITTGSLNIAREYHTATLLPNGMVLIVGGYGSTGYLASAELFNPATGIFSSTGSLNTARANHTATLLPNGLVLIAGGDISGGYTGNLASAELYNPATGTFATTGSLNTARAFHTATLLGNGTVLIVGGMGNTRGPGNYYDLSSAELYNPSTGTFSATGSLPAFRTQAYHTATPLQNGQVLIAVGTYHGGGTANAELYDPTTGTFSVTGSSHLGGAGQSATLLPSGLVLIVGSNGQSSPSGDLYNPSTGTWTLTGNLNTTRLDHTATLLDDGTVLIAGGGVGFGYLSSAELYNPSTGTFSVTGSMNFARYSQTATLLNNGTVLMAAGQRLQSPQYLGSAELYYPSIVINSLSSSSGAPGLQVIISGRGFLSAGSVKFGSSPGSFTVNNDTQITAVVPAGASPGNVVVASAGASSNGVAFTVVTPPAISASVSPAPNSAGWVNMNATVTFTCTPGGLPITSCPSPQTVSTEGAGQIIGGAVFDTAGDSATVGVTVNLDKTIPTLTVTSPADGTSETASPVTVSGTLSDSLSGASGVTCDGVAAALSGGSFSCTVSLGVGNNLVTVWATDIAGNVAGDNFHLSLTGSLPAPNSLQVTPTGVNMVVGGTQQFTVVDDQGRPRSDATWTVDNTSIATIDTNSSPTLTAVATGTATLTATVGSVTAQTQVNILSGTSLPTGTVLWSSPTPSGSTVEQILNAVPGLGLPDLYSVEYTGAALVVRALTKDGRQLWASSPVAAHFAGGYSSSVFAVPDGNGGIVLAFWPGATSTRRIMDLDGQSAAQVWDYDSTVQYPNIQTETENGLAVSQTGTVYFTNRISSSVNATYSLEALDGTTGAHSVLFSVPQATQTIPACPPTYPQAQVNPYPGSRLTGPVVGPDGTVYAAMTVTNATLNYYCTPGAGIAYQGSLSLIQLPPGGSPSVTALETDNTDNSLSAGAVIPDGNGGALVSWGTSASPSAVLDVTSSGTSNATMSSLSVPASQMVLGDSGTGLAYATDGFAVVAFGVSGSPSTWVYIPASGSEFTQIGAAIMGGGLNIFDKNSSSSPATYSVIPLNSSGTPGTPISTFANSSYAWTGQLTASPNNAATDAIQAPLALYAENFWSTPAGEPAENDAAGATCACDFETSDPSQPPPPPTNCPICHLSPPTSQPTCTSMAGSQSTYLILVGDPGTVGISGLNHNVGDLFNLSAQTQANSLAAQGHGVIACRVSTLTLFYAAMTQNGLLDGGVIYFGHSGVHQEFNADGSLRVQTSNIFVGQTSGLDTNISVSNVSSLSGVQTANSGANTMGTNSALTVNGCNAGLTIFDPVYGGEYSIAQLISNNIGRGVYAYKPGMHFNSVDSKHDKTRAGEALKLADALPMYMIPDGAVGNKPPAVPFTPH